MWGAVFGAAKLHLFERQELSNVIGRIYDCAVDPTLWLSTLTIIRDKLDMAYVHINFLDTTFYMEGSNTQPGIFQSPWSQEWIDILPRYLHKIPGIENWVALDIDDSISQMQHVPESEFHQSEIYQEWVKPQGLRDYCYTTMAKRQTTTGSIGAASYASRGLITEPERDCFRMLAPHIRRSLLISGMLDEGKLQLQLYRKLLDRIGAGILIVGQDARLVYANELADQLLSEGTTLTVRHNKLTTASLPHAKALKEALDRACTENDSAIGNFGNGIALTGIDGSVAVCYVLPLGKSERRRELGPGLAAVFITTNGASLPPALEVLSALSGLTSREARIALMVADGQSPVEASQALGISVNTLRTHLARIFEKTGVNSQMGLAKFVGGLSLPIVAVSAQAGGAESQHEIGD